MANVNPTAYRDHHANIDWGATRARMVSRHDRPTNYLRRARPSRENHHSHHQKTYRMAR